MNIPLEKRNRKKSFMADLLGHRDKLCRQVDLLQTATKSYYKL